MDFFETVRNRFSIRGFTPELIEENKVKQIIEAINFAPSAMNLQSYEIVLVREFSLRKKIAQACMKQMFIENAPIVLVFLADPLKIQAQLSKDTLKSYSILDSTIDGRKALAAYAFQDATIACSYAQLACTALGISSCWIGTFREKEILEIVNAPKRLMVTAVLPIGYPAKEHRPRQRRDAKEIVRENKF
jgi:nitroreductase